MFAANQIGLSGGTVTKDRRIQYPVQREHSVWRPWALQGRYGAEKFLQRVGNSDSPLACRTQIEPGRFGRARWRLAGDGFSLVERQASHHCESTCAREFTPPDCLFLGTRSALIRLCSPKAHTQVAFFPSSFAISKSSPATSFHVNSQARGTPWPFPC